MRPVTKCRKVVLVTCFAAATPLAAQRALPQVHIVATGGTIASTNYYSGQGPSVAVDQLVRAVPALDTVARITAQQFSNVASSAMTNAMWLSLARGIADTLRARPNLAGVVVTHGTDTMEETAYFLDLTVADPRPVIVTGAMRPADGVGVDGPANLLHAVRVAVHPASRGRGAMVVMNDEIFAARDVTKSNAVRPDAFTAPYRGDLGIADPETIRFHRVAVRRPLFDLAPVRELPRVDIVYSHAGADGAFFTAAIAAGAKGLIIAATGRGGIPPLQRDAIDSARAKGIIVIVASRTGGGSVAIGDGVTRRAGDRARATIGAGDLNPQKARVLLMLALTRTSDAAEIARTFQAHQ